VRGGSTDGGSCYKNKEVDSIEANNNAINRRLLR
jgi:hypothetical protein